MPAPTATDGAARGIEVIAIPSAFAIIAVVVVNHFYGSIVAGLVFLAITIVGLLTLFVVAKYWNAAYTLGFVVVGFFALLMIPSVLAEFVHPAFDILVTIAVLVAIIGIATLLISKFDLNRPSRR